MAVTTTHATVDYNGNGVTTVFPVTYQFFAADDLRVIETDADGNETVKTLTIHYTVSGGQPADGTPATGTVTMLAAPASGITLTIRRSTPQTQQTTFANNDAFPAKTVEAAYDRRTLIEQELQRDFDRSLGGTIEEALEAAALAGGYAAAAAAERTQTGLDRVQTGLDRTQTGLDRVQTGLDALSTAADRSFVSALLALGITGIYANTTAGLAATADGGYFLVSGTSDVFVSLYREVSGVAVLQGTLPSSVYVDRIRDAVSVVYRNVFLKGTMDFGTLNPGRYANSDVLALTTQKGLVDLGLTHAVKQRTGGDEYAFQGGVPDLRLKYGVISMVVYSTDAADISGITQVDAILNDGSATVQVTNFVSTTKTEIQPNTWLVTSQIVFPNQSNPTTQLWIGTQTTPNTANRLMTAFFCYASDAPQPAAPIILQLKDYWMARMAAREATSVLDLVTDTRKETITLLSCDKILVAGDSYTETLHTLRHKGWVQMAAMLTDWNLIGYGVGGNDNLDIALRLLTNEQNYGFGPQNLSPSHVWAKSQTNDSVIQAEGYQYWKSDIKRLARVASAIAGNVIISTEHPALADHAHSLQREAAREVGADFCDITTEAGHFYKVDVNLTSGSHPGTRTNSYIWSPAVKFLNEEMPRPRSGLKMFRVRPGYTVSALDDLVYDAITQRAERFEELAVGYRALSTAARTYYDDLDGTTLTSDIILSECGRMSQGIQVQADDYFLMEFILPATGPDVRAINVTVPSNATGIYALNRMTAFPFDAANRDAPYYTEFDTPVGTWQSVLSSATGSLVTGAITINPRFYMQGDKLALLLRKTGTMNVGGPSLTVTYRKEKYNPKPARIASARGPSILAQTRCGEASELAAWTITGSVVGVAPTIPLPLAAAVSKVAPIDDENYISQTFQTDASRPQSTEYEIVVWAYRYLPLFNSGDDFSTSLVQPGTYDLVDLEIYIGDSATALEFCCPLSEPVGLGFMEIRRRVWLVGSDAVAGTTKRITVRGKAGHTIHVGMVDVRKAG